MIYTAMEETPLRRTLSLDEVRDAVASQGPVSAKALAAHFDRSDTLVRRHLKNLQSDGTVVEVGRDGREVKYAPAA